MARWMRFEHDGRVKFGTVDDSEVVVHEGDMFDSPRPTSEVIPLVDVDVLIPATAGKMLALWNNSRSIAEKMELDPPRHALYFLKTNGSYLADRGVIKKPATYDGKVAFEGELGIVIGKECRRVTEEDADSCIFGYTCVNDVTAVGLLNEDPQFPQWTRAKSFDTFGVFGPVVATGLDPASLSIRTVYNGQERQNYPVTDLFLLPATVVSMISQDLTLHPGDVICCGTSRGVGSMKPGSNIEVTIEGIGTLGNRYEE